MIAHGMGWCLCAGLGRPPLTGNVKGKGHSGQMPRSWLTWCVKIKMLMLMLTNNLLLYCWGLKDTTDSGV